MEIADIRRGTGLSPQAEAGSLGRPQLRVVEPEEPTVDDLSSLEKAPIARPDEPIDYDLLSNIAEDTLRIYLAEAGRAKLLTAQEEQSLSRDFLRGRDAAVELGHTSRIVAMSFCEPRS